MIRQKKLAAVLAGVSFIALSASAMPAFAAGTTISGPGSFPTSWSVSTQVPTDRDYIVINNGFVVNGDVNLDANIGGGPGVQNDHGFYLDNGAVVTGNVNISAAVDANVYVTNNTNDAGTSLAAVLVDDGAQVGGAIINNSNGSVVASARAHSVQDATAEAFGIATLLDVNSDVQNYGEVAVHATATGYDTSLAIAGGVGQVTMYEETSAGLYNDGSVDAVSRAKSVNGHTDSSTDTAISLAFGAGQLAIGSTVATYITNASQGHINAHAYGSATGTGNQQSFAAGVGVAQAALGEFTATADLYNDGTIHAQGNSHASSSDPLGEAYALAAGIGSLQIAGTVYDEATASIINDGFIGGAAFANANAYDAAANAVAVGTLQVAGSVYGVATAKLDNQFGGQIEGYGSAAAYGAYATADSYVIGAAQIAIGVGDAGVADITNDGRIDAWAHSYANGDAYAAAEADAAAVKQLSLNVFSSAQASLTNYGELDAHAYASAYAYLAHATAAATGVVQFAAGLGPVTDTLTNDGGIIADAWAQAGAFAGSAKANAQGVAQDALSLDNATLTATNNVYISAAAHADVGFFEPPVPYAEAQAYATGIFQGSLTLDLSGLGLTSITSVIGSHVQLPVSIAGSANALVTNNGFIGAHADAYAEAFANATATAESIGVNQSFYNVAGNSTATVDNNSGSVIVSNAHAVAYAEGDALAYATSTGVNQDVASLLGGDASAIVDNMGLVMGHAVASAYGSSNASAYAHGAGVSQNAQTLAGGTTSASLTNSGNIVGSADAYAISDEYNSDAEAKAYALGVAQNADSLVTSLATAQLTNEMGQYSSSGIHAFAHVSATAHFANASGYATAVGVYQEASTGATYTATASITNDGVITAYAAAYASALYDATAEAGAFGIGQFASSLSGQASATITNNDLVSAYASADAIAGEDYVLSRAIASGIYQKAESGNDSATADITNTGDVSAFARADGWSFNSDAHGYATAIGVAQIALSDINGNATGTVDNTADGVIVATAESWMWATDHAQASAFAFGAAQHVDAYLDTALASLTNDGGIAARAYATASDFDSAAATAVGFALASGVYQSAASFHGNATAELTNSSTGNIQAEAYANAYASDNAYATAVAHGVYQDAFGGNVNSVDTITADNDGRITAYAVANASATSSSGYAQAHAYATGVSQYVSTLGTASLEVTNTGYIGASAVAYASASTSSGDASVQAFATGVSQFAAGENGGSVTFDNSGTVQAFAKGYADASDEWAVAEAVGQYAGGAGDVTLDVTNEKPGHITANAFVSASDGQAFAVGAWEGGDSFSTLSGTINNDGMIHASATALNGGSAQAIGVLESGEGSNTTVLTNTGGIFAYAYGSDAQATGISIAGGSGLVPFINPQSAPIVNNDGGVIVAQIDINGSQSRGNAINTRGSTNRYIAFNQANGPVEINLMGGDSSDLGKAYVMANPGLVSDDVKETFHSLPNYGYIYGNIQLTEDDTVNVSNGATIFDGQFNADNQYNGVLNIQDGGILVLVQNHDPLDPESGGTVDTLNMSSGGTLAVELNPNQGKGDYPQLNTNSANLDGTLQVVYDAGLYSNTGYYADVITGNVAGTFANVTDNQVLLDTTAIYYDSHVDIGYERVAFNAVEGLTKNQKNVGGAIEKVYPNIDPNTAFGDLVADMFTLDAAAYKNELDQLSGSQYANHLQSVLWSTRAIDRVITERMECKDDTSHDKMASYGDATVGNNTVTPTADVISSTGCFHPGEANIWMSGFGQWNKLSGDSNAPGYDETQYGILFGADYSFTDSLFFGVAGGYFNSKGNFDNWGGASGASIDYDGLNLAAYGGYDNSTYYLRGIVAYGNYSGDAHRSLALDAPNTEYSTLKGSPSSDTWSFYGETGYRFNLSSVGQITPFLGLSIATANLDGFTEKDPDNSGAALNVHSSTANSVASVLGARFTADMAMGSGVFSPVLSVAWMHEFDDTRQEVNMSFAGAPSGATFTSVGTNVARDSAVVDAGAKFQFNDALNVGLYYNGQFNSDYTSNGVTATLGYKF